MGEPRVELLEHTADLGLLARADDLPALLLACAERLVRLRCPEGEIRARSAREVAVEGHDPAELLVGWLREINTLMALHGELYAEFRIDALEVEGEPPLRLRGVARGEPVDPARHRLELEIKAVTYHAADLVRTADGWRGQVILDV
jgi:SHS2 domain-containing protein